MLFFEFGDVPASVQYVFNFLPQIILHEKALRLRLTARFVEVLHEILVVRTLDVDLDGEIARRHVSKVLLDLVDVGHRSLVVHLEQQNDADEESDASYNRAVLPLMVELVAALDAGVLNKQEVLPVRALFEQFCVACVHVALNLVQCEGAKLVADALILDLVVHPRRVDQK